MESVTNGVELPAPYPLAKQHKAIVPGKASSRLIVAQFRSYVRELSNFFHMQLNWLVNKHPTILKNSRELVARIEGVVPLGQECFLDSAEVTALYPSMDQNTTMDAIQWFMDTHCNSRFPTETKRFILIILKFVLTETYMRYDGTLFFLEQISSSAMGVISSVCCGNSYLQYCERKVLVIWKARITLYKRFLDNVALQWKGTLLELV